MPLLRVQTINGSEILIEIDGEDTVFNVKNKIDEKIGMDPFKQILSCNGSVLENEERIAAKMNFIFDTPLQLMIKGNGAPKQKDIYKETEEVPKWGKRCCTII